MKSEKKVELSKVMVSNPMYEGDGPVYDSVQTQDIVNSVTESNMLRSILTTNGQDTNIYQSLNDTAHKIDHPVQLHHSLHTNAASNGSDTENEVYIEMSPAGIQCNSLNSD